MKKFKFTITLIIFGFQLLLPQTIIKSDNSNPEEHNLVKLKSLIRDSEYILGPGDKLYLRFFGEKDFSGELDIINDGTISIPIVGDVYVAGLTKKMAEEKIEDLLTPHLIQKDVQVLILNPRKIKVIIIGEVNSPGIYSMTEKEISYTNSDEKRNFSLFPKTIEGLPTLVDAIQKSGGLTPEADISNIIIKRKTSSVDNSNKYNFSKLNLLKLVKEGDFDQNLVLFDGDVITIKKNLNPDKKLLTDFGNLSKSSIGVFVVGEVNNPGFVEINYKSSIAKAILAAGGPKNFRSNKSNIKILTDDNLGGYKLKRYKFDLRDIQNNRKNKPYLKNGDVIFVDTSQLSKTGDAINIITKPFVGLYQTLQFINLLNNE